MGVTLAGFISAGFGALISLMLSLSPDAQLRGANVMGLRLDTLTARVQAVRDRLDLPHVEALCDDRLRHRFRVGLAEQRARVAG